MWACPVGRFSSQILKTTLCNRSSIISSVQCNPWLFRSPRGHLSLPTYKAFTSSPSSSMELLSEHKNLLLKQQEEKQGKWGWVIYRCTYNDDEGWARFKHIINERSLASIAKSDAPELADSLEWTFVEDHDTLDGASRGYLRSRFNAWAKNAIVSENPRDETPHIKYENIPRYSYFVQVDESSLKSVVYEAPQPPKSDFNGVGHVNFVSAEWVPASEGPEESLPTPNSLAEEDTFEPIDGCCDEDVGWMKMASWMVGPSFYGAMFGYSDVWYCFYQRPPETANW